MRSGETEAVMVVLRRARRVLVVRRGPEAPMSGYWSPVSGRVEPGESQEAAVVREIREEVGLGASAVAKVWESRTHDDRFRLHWWVADAEPGPLRLHPGEVSEARWIAPSDFPTLEPTFDSHREFFSRVLPGLEMGTESAEEWVDDG